MKKQLITIILIILALTLGCAKPDTAPEEEPVPGVDITDKSFCEADGDCICGGIDTDGSCFMGNKDYYEQNVKKARDCPDFCEGIAGNLVTRCVDNKCIQMFQCLKDEDCDSGACRGNICVRMAFAQCGSDADCKTGGCSGEMCIPKSSTAKPSICIMRPEYECLKMIDCGCVGGKCAWKTTRGYDDCVEEKS
ncbi:eight-cysteine-cluster domain-containing protein [Candidatus Woesearchaeota archaeon]|nr:eight-cysteine-cluster domain-containing protein [Candidatus Woesearchaeota archaeon]